MTTQELANDPKINAQAGELYQRLIYESNEAAGFMQRACLIATIAAAEKDALEAENVALRKRLIPDGVPVDYDPETEEPPLPKLEVFINIAVLIFLLGIVIGMLI